MKIKMRFLLVGLIILMIAASSFFVYALLIDTKTKGPVTFSLGKLEYELLGDIKSGYIVPGENIVSTPYKITNKSTIETEIRVSVTFKLDGLVFNDFENVLNIFDEEDWTIDGDYYQYKHSLSSNQEIILFSELILDGFSVKSGFSGKKFNVIVTLQAKQKNHMEWSNIPS